MDNPLGISLRFASYFDLMLLFGLPLFFLYTWRGEERTQAQGLACLAPLLAAIAAAGLLLSFASMLQMATVMSGASGWLQAWPHVWAMIVETELGLTWMLRIGALCLALGIALAPPLAPDRRLPSTGLLGGVALATLAWGGHGAMHDGPLGVFHLANDILHLLAAGGWLGALAGFSLMLFRRGIALGWLVRALQGFEWIGGLFVTTLVVTGAINYLMIAGLRFGRAIALDYWLLLVAKLALFALMLGMALLNRIRLAPALQQGYPARATRNLRLSIGLEFLAALAILVLVAWLGTLGPET